MNGVEAFATMNRGDELDDRLVEVDPATGAVVTTLQGTPKKWCGAGVRTELP
jgi:hypothetical protein